MKYIWKPHTTKPLGIHKLRTSQKERIKFNRKALVHEKVE
jgi:hypothetical protein